ncbi:Spy/CpxP family protein refolding chaperone [bacterium]|nr:Spy/CpxP family protein refolding chaperone [bacterium]
MKKILVLFTVLIFSLTMANANEAVVKPEKIDNQQNVKIQRENRFEKRLGLSEEQKIKAREIRIKGHQKIRPVMDEIMMKKQEAMMVKMSRIAVEEQEKRLDVIDKELKVLEKKAHDIKRENFKEFESILTRSQKKILKEMKKEGRKKYQSTHPMQNKMLPIQK